MIGQRAKLLGDSSRYLAIWLSMIKHGKPAVAIHECTPYFDQSVFQKYLGESFEIHRFEEPHAWKDLSRNAKVGGPRVWLLSPTLFGWPCSRPRLYTVLTNKSVCMLQGRGLACMEHLYMKVNMQVADLFCAPKEEIAALRKAQAKKAARPSTDPFKNFLQGAKPVYRDGYCTLKKVQKRFEKKSSRQLDWINVFHCCCSNKQHHALFFFLCFAQQRTQIHDLQFEPEPEVKTSGQSLSTDVVKGWRYVASCARSPRKH
ncbi:unnamed protein product [Durusdinium trenchii]|uniref:Uncharacterized protein n=1 Tax=Durusdinium trenchii TaxID=1381693 RepID=A0ABP0NIS9_9DINO